MRKTDIIRKRLETTFAPQHLAIFDDSEKHAGHSGANPKGESHFTIEIISEKFSGLSHVASHRLINETLADLFAQGLHALSIRASAPKEKL
jgi:BolA family transcriptional regulator, general stress-responsive regulator